MRDVLKFWRTKGYKIVIYLDDGMGGAATLHATKYISLEVKKDLENLGFLIAEDKSYWEPVQKLVWLGFIWDMTSNK